MVIDKDITGDTHNIGVFQTKDYQVNEDKKAMMTAVDVMQGRTVTYLATLRPSEEMDKVIKLVWHLAHLKDCMEGKDTKEAK